MIPRVGPDRSSCAGQSWYQCLPWPGPPGSASAGTPLVALIEARSRVSGPPDVPDPAKVYEIVIFAETGYIG